jgi:hypothetical protein
VSPGFTRQLFRSRHAQDSADRPAQTECQEEEIQATPLYTIVPRMRLISHAICYDSCAPLLLTTPILYGNRSRLLVQLAYRPRNRRRRSPRPNDPRHAAVGAHLFVRTDLQVCPPTAAPAEDARDTEDRRPRRQRRSAVPLPPAAHRLVPRRLRSPRGREARLRRNPPRRWFGLKERIDVHPGPVTRWHLRPPSVTMPAWPTNRRSSCWSLPH